jgi:hypothetical protein
MKSKLSVLVLFPVLFSSCYYFFHKKKPFPQPPSVVYVPSGTYNDGTQDHEIEGLWMNHTEVTNLDYHEYLDDLLFENSDSQLYKEAYPDTSLIGNELWISKHFNYFEDPLFYYYPVVGLTVDQVEAYAKWFTNLIKSWYPNSNYTFRLPVRRQTNLNF